MFLDNLRRKRKGSSVPDLKEMRKLSVRILTSSQLELPTNKEFTEFSDQEGNFRCHSLVEMVTRGTKEDKFIMIYEVDKLNCGPDE